MHLSLNHMLLIVASVATIVYAIPGEEKVAEVSGNMEFGLAGQDSFALLLAKLGRKKVLDRLNNMERNTNINTDLVEIAKDVYEAAESKIAEDKAKAKAAESKIAEDKAKAKAAEDNAAEELKVEETKPETIDEYDGTNSSTIVDQLTRAKGLLDANYDISIIVIEAVCQVLTGEIDKAKQMLQTSRDTDPNDIRDLELGANDDE